MVKPKKRGIFLRIKESISMKGLAGKEGSILKKGSKKGSKKGVTKKGVTKNVVTKNVVTKKGVTKKGVTKNVVTKNVVTKKGVKKDSVAVSGQQDSAGYIDDFLVSNEFLSNEDSPKTKNRGNGLHRIKTGIKGLDKILKGGLRKESSIILTGGPGTGKTIMGIQFLIEGAKNGEVGIYVFYDSSIEDFLLFADEIGLSLRKYIEKGLIFVTKQPLLMKRIVSLIAPLDLIRSKKAKRVVLDSLTTFSYIHVANEREYRKTIIDFLDKTRDVTLLAISESNRDSVLDQNFKTEDFLFDGLIMLSKIRQESTFERVLHVSKMRGQDHMVDIFPFFIKQGGVEVFPNQLPFALVEEGKNGFDG
jgi:KaiC/GvpD/RAD55 family RecA-like ATPase